MTNKDIICIMCPLGCKLEVSLDGGKVLNVKGGRCKEGAEYAQQEAWAPCRILTTTVRTGNTHLPLLPIRSAKPIQKEKILECMTIINKQMANEPIRMGEVIIADILGTGVDIIASSSIPSK